MEITNDEWEGLNSQLRNFSVQFVHDDNHRRVPLTGPSSSSIEGKAAPMAIQDKEPPPSEAPFSFFTFGVLDVLGILPWVV